MDASDTREEYADPSRSNPDPGVPRRHICGPRWKGSSTVGTQPEGARHRTVEQKSARALCAGGRGKACLGGAKGGSVNSAEDIRALELYRLALSLVVAKGHFRTTGLMPFKEYRAA